jgi:phage terminase Nu1 subunit (DNA packaging protein)
MTQDKLFCNQRQAAKILGTTTKTVQLWEVPSHSRKGRELVYYIPEIVAWRVAQLEGRHGPDDLCLEAERARLAAAQADKTELDLAVRRGELLSVGLVYRAWETLLIGVRARMLALPTKLAAELAITQDSNAIRARLTDEVIEILAEASAHRAEAADLDFDRPNANA